MTLAISGLCMIAGSWWIARAMGRPLRPGKLIARRDALTWQSPNSGTCRALGLDEAGAIFEVENVGNYPTSITDVESSCGCATPRVEPRIIAPGKIGTVEVKAVPLQIGERMATVKLRTDSPATPEVLLRLRIVGSRRPPFLAQAVGDLTFREDPPQAGPREIIATTIEEEETPPRPPLVRTDCPQIHILEPRLAEERPSSAPRTVSRKYTFDATLATALPSNLFSADGLVIDPWDAEHVERIRAHVDIPPPLRVAPSRAFFRLQRGKEPEQAVVDFLVLSDEAQHDFVVEYEPSVDPPLLIGAVKPDEVGRRGSFSITLKPGQAREGEYQLLVGRRSSPDRVIVPVAVIQEKGS